MAEDILILVQVASLDGSLATTVQLPQAAVLALCEADVVEFDVGFGAGGFGVALGGGFFVGCCEGRCFLEDLGAAEGVEGDALLDELVERATFLYVTGQYCKSLE